MIYKKHPVIKSKHLVASFSLKALTQSKINERMEKEEDTASTSSSYLISLSHFLLPFQFDPTEQCRFAIIFNRHRKPLFTSSTTSYTLVPFPSFSAASLKFRLQNGHALTSASAPAFLASFSRSVAHHSAKSS